MKQRFSAIDLKAELTCLKNAIVGHRLANVYDLNGKTKFLLKFAIPDEKAFLLVESGIRLHLTSYARDRSGSLPTGFTAKLRKHLRTKRLVSIAQHGLDRSADFQFGAGSHAYHLIIELYSAGNLILTDHEYRIMALLRTVRSVAESETNLQSARTNYACGEIYRTDLAAPFTAVQPDHLTDLLTRAKLETGKRNQSLRKLLVTEFASSHGTTLIDHLLAEAHINGTTPVLNFSEIDRLADGFSKVNKLVQDLDGPESPKGYLHCKATDGSSSGEIDSVFPFAPANLDQSNVSQLDAFDTALDEYFTKVEAARLSAKRAQVEDQVRKKLDNIATSQQKQVQSLLAEQENALECAMAIEANVKLVEQVLDVVRQLVASGIDWKDLEQLLKREQKAGNGLALHIRSCKLENGQILIRLPTYKSDDAESDSDSATCSGSDSGSSLSSESSSSGSLSDSSKKKVGQFLDVFVDIYCSAYANAKQYYEQRKRALIKAEKTQDSKKKAEKKVKQTTAPILQGSLNLKTGLAKLRKPFWFEKFIWFVSSEGYLVIGGRDAKQNEQIVRKYMRNSDVYVHADMHGACSVVIRQIQGAAEGAAIPPNTLNQAGTLSVCCSRAWEAKIVASAYWVYASQVSKTAPTGEYLSTGSFMIRGKKNFLPPVQLQFGAGLLFLFDEDDPDTKANHPKYVEWVPSYRGDFDAVVDVAETPASAESEFAKYSLDGALPQSVVEEELKLLDLAGNENSNNASSGKRYLSARQRRELRKQAGDQRNTGLDSEQHKTTTTKACHSLNGEKDAANVSSTRQGKLPRGKKFKLRKIKTKYKDQDEEDRQLMLELMGSVKRSDLNEAHGGDDIDGSALKAKSDDPTLDMRDDLEKSPEALEQNFHSDSAPVQDAGDDLESVGGSDGGDLAEVSPLNFDDMEFLNRLTASPKPKDSLVGCLVMLAPWQALSKFSFRIKLLPGSMKKGKACKLVLHQFSCALQSLRTDVAKSKSRLMRRAADSVGDEDVKEDVESLQQQAELIDAEFELVKSIKEEEMVMQMLPKVRVAGKLDLKSV